MRRIQYLAWVGSVCLFLCVQVIAQDIRTGGAGAMDVQASATSSVPRLIRFSGVVNDVAGKPLPGAVEVSFSLYEVQEGGSAIWWERQAVEADAQGRYAVLLGSTQAEGLSAEIFASGKTRWLEVEVQGLSPQPRVLLVSVPYAMKAEDAERLGGKKATDFVLAEQLKEEVKTAVSLQVVPVEKAGATKEAALTALADELPKLVVASGQSSFTCSTTTPCVTVSQSSTGIGVQATAKTLGLFGVANATTGTTFGVRGQTPSTTGRGVFGYASATTGGTIGVYGLAPSTSGVAVLGDANATTGATRGVIGRTSSASGIGVWGYATKTSGTTTGVRGDVWSSSGTAGYFDNRAGGKILSGRKNGVEKFSVSGSGNVTAAGNVIAASFSGSGAGLTGVNALTAASAATASIAGNAESLGGVAAANYARRDTSNTFTGDQTVNGSLTVSGTVTGTAFVGDGSGLTVDGSTVAALLAKIQELEEQVALLPDLARPGGRLWANRFGSSDDDNGYAIAVDANGDLLVTGRFSGTVDFGSGPLTSAGLRDIFVAKFSGVDGTHLWSKRFGDSSWDVGRGLAVDGSGNVLVAGYFNDTVDFGGGPLTSAGASDIFVAKFSGVDGAHLWSKRFGDTAVDLVDSGIALDGTGNVLVTGLFLGTVDFGGGPLTNAGVDEFTDIFVAKLSGVDGAHVWSKRFGDVYSDAGSGIAVDRSGNVLVTGSFEGTVDFGGGALTSAGYTDIFVVKFSGVDGAHLWSKRFGDTDPESGLGIAADGSGNVLVTDFFQGTVNFGGGPLTSAGGWDIFVAKLSGVDGAHLWSKRFGDTSSDSGFGIAVDGSGSVVVTGFFQGTVDFGGGPLTNAGVDGFVDIFVAKFSGADGAHTWSKRFGDVYSDAGSGIAVDGSGNVLVTGSFEGTVDFGGETLTSAGVDDIFVLKLRR